jgi:hypothetical protein
MSFLGRKSSIRLSTHLNGRPPFSEVEWRQVASCACSSPMDDFGHSKPSVAHKPKKMGLAQSDFHRILLVHSFSTCPPIIILPLVEAKHATLLLSQVFGKTWPSHEMILWRRVGSYFTRAYLSFIQLQSLELVCTLEVTFLGDSIPELVFKDPEYIYLNLFEINWQQTWKGGTLLYWIDERYICIW